MHKRLTPSRKGLVTGAAAAAVALFSSAPLAAAADVLHPQVLASHTMISGLNPICDNNQNQNHRADSGGSKPAILRALSSGLTA